VNVPLLDLKRAYEPLREKIEGALLDVCSSQQFVLGPAVERFERNFARYVGSPHAVACASGTDALLLALKALDIGEGDEVITTPFSFFATASSISRAGARPVFADIVPATFNIDPRCVEKAITPRTRALLPVHLFGQCAAMEELCEIASRRGLAVIEDACQAVGASRGGQRAGTFGDAAAFSFYPTKNLAGFGDSGMVTMRSEKLAQRVRSLRVHGTAEEPYLHNELGYNSRMDALQAVVLDAKLPSLDGWLEERRAIAAQYTQLLRHPLIVLPETDPLNVHTYHQYTVRIKRGRDQVREFLSANGVGSKVFYPVPLHLQPCFRGLGYGRGDFPVSEEAAAQVISLPIFPGLQPCEVERVAEVLLQAVQNVC